VLKEATNEISRWPQEIDFIAVTIGPGLIPSLLVGTNVARVLSYATKKPLVGVNHLEGHIYSNWLAPARLSAYNQTPPAKYFKNRKPQFPAICLIVSGGHTELILMKNYGKYRLLGKTRDDAAGEAFDKIARMLNLGYPGGPIIDKLSRQGNSFAFSFPRPMIHTKTYDFSFSGLKTAVHYLLDDLAINELERKKPDIAASFQEAVVETLVSKTLRAAQEFNTKTIMISGGVSANSRLRKVFSKAGRKLKKVKILFPPMELTTDNAAMIAIAGYFNWLSGKKNSWKTLKADANLTLMG
ncbi:MAG: tRNA (adenosine(37)-N6)-threonylcarbamoyltransferase complex transferase subunit TsaD, partial [Candidatus Paceibacteria bacterium]